MSAEPYTDEELREWTKRLDATAAVGFGDPRVAQAVRRVLDEKAEARRVARVLAEHDWCCSEWSTCACSNKRPFLVRHAIETALAYPESSR